MRWAAMFDSLQRSVNLRPPPRLTILQGLTGLLAPPVCCLCGAAGQRGEEVWGLDLCRYCEADCPRPQMPCPVCASPHAGAGTCETCLASPPPFDSTTALFLYADPVDQMITGLKFQGELCFARVLGTLLARELRLAGKRLPHCVVPLPLHVQRYRERGFSQTGAIAAHVTRRLGVPLDNGLLQRTRATSAQSGLPAEARAANLRQAFTVPSDRRPPLRVALLDDVMTTGHTAAAAASALKQAGCREVHLWICARA